MIKIIVELDQLTDFMNYKISGANAEESGFLATKILDLIDDYKECFKEEE